MQSFSAWLLFATAANACGEANDNILTRGCVLQAAADVEDWTGGGLHAPTDPDPEGGPSPDCGMLLEVTDDGNFARLYPEIGGEGDDSRRLPLPRQWQCGRARQRGPGHHQPRPARLSVTEPTTTA